jgi:membrane associated rhomboid family serine protease
VDFNRILLFIAVISPLLVLARAWRPGPYRGWRIASLTVLAAAGIDWVLLRDKAGYISGLVWFVVLFVPAIGLRKVAELAAQRRFAAARKLSGALRLIHPSRELREHVAFFRAIESEQHHPPPPIQPARDEARPRRLSRAPIVAILILLNAAAFVFASWNRDLANPETLHRLGALEPFAVIWLHQYWRLVTALFLHVGAAHLFFNLFALYVLGPGLERSLGSTRFGTVYLMSGLGASGGVVALSAWGLIQPAQVVGASGCIMGIVGAWAGFLLRHRHAPRAKERLWNILLIIGIQAVFDFTTPQVSTAAHLCGLVTGFVVGLAIAPREAGASLKR